MASYGQKRPIHAAYVPSEDEHEIAPEEDEEMDEFHEVLNFKLHCYGCVLVHHQQMKECPWCKLLPIGIS